MHTRGVPSEAISVCINRVMREGRGKSSVRADHRNSVAFRKRCLCASAFPVDMAAFDLWRGFR